MDIMGFITEILLNLDWKTLKKSSHVAVRFCIARIRTIYSNIQSKMKTETSSAMKTESSPMRMFPMLR